jgi:hypothetical protein
MPNAAREGIGERVPARVEMPEHPGNCQVGGPLCPLAFERFDLVAARCELDCAHRAFRTRPSHYTAHRFFKALRRHRALIAEGAPHGHA